MTSADQPTRRPITPEQVRTARVALGWSLERLAARSETTAYGIGKYEKFGRVASKRGQRHDFDVLSSIRVALESAGVEFTNSDEPGAKLKRHPINAVDPLAARPITPQQARDARILLGWSLHRLSHLSKIPTGFIYRFEATGCISGLRWRPREFDGLAAIRTALEQAGVTFTDGDELGVKLRKTSSGSSE